MTSCDQYQSTVVALFDNEARDEDLRLVAGHLQNCPECRTFCLDMIALRRAEMAAAVPGLSPAARQQVLTSAKADRPVDRDSHEAARVRMLSLARLGRWAALLIIGVLSIACLALGKTAGDLRTRLTGAEQQVAAIHAEQERAESEERHQKAISALYFRMAELEQRVDHFSPSRRASYPAETRSRPEENGSL